MTYLIHNGCFKFLHAIRMNIKHIDSVTGGITIGHIGNLFFHIQRNARHGQTSLSNRRIGRLIVRLTKHSDSIGIYRALQDIWIDIKHHDTIAKLLAIEQTVITIIDTYSFRL